MTTAALRHDDSLGLRERKRRATRRRIQLAVLQLVDRRGLDQVTIDDISREADVSPRTFFNYFPTKEDSLAGDPPFVLTDEVAAAFEHAGPHGDPLEDVLAIMGDQASEEGAVDPELHQLRRRVMVAYPQIFALRMDRLRESEAVIAAAVERRLAADARDKGEEHDPVEGAERARLTSLLALTLARSAWLSSTEHPELGSLPEVLSRSYGRLRELLGVTRSEV